MYFQQPPFLVKNDKVAIVAPAKKFDPADLEPAIEIIQSWGLEVVLGKNVFDEYFQFAGTDDARWEDMQIALDDQDIKAIFCVRGGYGTGRFIDLLSFSRYKRNPKWIIGFSDVTVMHGHLHRKGFQTVHGPMPLLFQKKTTEKALENLKNLLFGKKIKYKIPTNKFNKEGIGSGALVGGNLSILCASIGTRSDIDTAGKILFIEDIDEYLYRVDRMMVQLKRAGKLNRLEGLIIGHFSDMKDNDQPFGKGIEELILDAVSGYNYPVVFNFPAGHEPENMPLLFGAEANLISGKKNAELNFQ